jgi:hypothetical protein
VELYLHSPSLAGLRFLSQSQEAQTYVEVRCLHVWNLLAFYRASLMTGLLYGFL